MGSVCVMACLSVVAVAGVGARLVAASVGRGVLVVVVGGFAAGALGVVSRVGGGWCPAAVWWVCGVSRDD